MIEKRKKQKITDQMGFTVLLNTEVKRIVSLVPSITELIAWLGKKDQLVGITRFCTHPKVVYKSVTRIGGTKDFKIDKIQTLQPDIVFANKEENEKNAIIELKKACTVWLSNVKTLPEAKTMIHGIGKILGAEQKSKALCSKLDVEFNKLKLAPTNKIPKATYLIWRKPYMSINGDTFIHNMLHLAGFKNVFAKTKLRYPTVDAEQLKIADPDIIFLSSEPYPFTDKHIQEFQNICPKAKVVLVDGALFSWYGSRLLQSPDYFLELRQQLNPY